MGDWSQFDATGHPVDLYTPTAMHSPFALIYLHSAGEENLQTELPYTQVMEELGLRCFCPHGGQAWWADRICAKFDPVRSAQSWLLNELLPRMEQDFNVRPPRIGLFGVSMGGQGALRLAFKHPTLFPVVAGISSALDYHRLLYQKTPLDGMYNSKEQCRQDAASMHLNPHQTPRSIFFCCDPADAFWFPGNDRLHEKLTALGVEHECDLTTSAGGHHWDYFHRMADRTIRFLHAGLVQEARRLL